VSDRACAGHEPGPLWGLFVAANGIYYFATISDPSEPRTVFPTDPSGALIPFGTSDPDPGEYQLHGSSISFYGADPVPSIFNGSTGVITFAASSGQYTAINLENHFEVPEISALSSMDATLGGVVTAKQTPDRIAVTYQDVPTGGIATGPKANVQIELFYDGTIQVTYPDVIASSGIVGLSRGGGVPGDFVPSDFTDLTLNTGPMKVAP
jgi:hypothetical protein